jgi:hypothetical protein
VEILNATGFSAVWDGGERANAVRVEPDPGTHAPAVSHFGSGTLTFHIPWLFKTDSGTDLFVTGPLNRPKDDIAAVTGIIETDWSPYIFTMNWQFTRAGHGSVSRWGLEAVMPEMRKLSENRSLKANIRAWSDSLNSFNEGLNDPNSDAVREKWQKSYFRGVCPSGRNGPEDHRSRLRLKPFG